MLYRWDTGTSPFSAGAELAQPGRFELRQVDDMFGIIPPFVYVRNARAPISVTPELLGTPISRLSRRSSAGSHAGTAATRPPRSCKTSLSTAGTSAATRVGHSRGMG